MMASAGRPTNETGLPFVLQEILGYLNFSSGAADARFLANLNEQFREAEAAGIDPGESHHIVRQRLVDSLLQLQQGSAAFADSDQASAVLALVFDRFLPAYRQFHHDLLFHQVEGELWRPFFVGRAFEAVLRQGPPWDESERIITDALASFNDYVGYRPVAVLHSGQRLEPYPHERLRPLPLFIQGAGVATGRYERLIQRTLELLKETDARLLTAAHFDLQSVEELALDVRAYDFDHPVNKRFNYCFGQWDPHQIDNRGNYRRFVLQQVTLDSLVRRVEQHDKLPKEERLVEASAVLAGVILMSSAICGSGPGTYDSTVSLATLLPIIAANRDAFYTQLLARMTGRRATRLQAEARTARQPFAAARQHLNQTLARRRATQLEQVHLSQLYARMGHRDAALEQARVVLVASARMRCEIQCRLTAGGMAAAAGRFDEAARMLEESTDFLQRAIGCGALIDPWNILGFQGQFSLFPAPENSVYDHRVDQLIELLEQLFGLFARCWSEAAARGVDDAASRLELAMDSLARWWDKFATTTVGGVESFSGSEAVESARHVAAALRAWHQAGATAGDIGFWHKHVANFQFPKAYALVVEALLDKHDLVAARALLIQWLSQADQVPLKGGQHSFHALAARWLVEASQVEALTSVATEQAHATRGQSRLITPFFDYLEANAEELWNVPTLSLETGAAAKADTTAPRDRDDEEESEEDNPDDDEQQPFSAAYDEMVYVDSTADGVEGDMLETPSPATDYELEYEGRRLRDRLAFLATVAVLWKRAATDCRPAGQLPAISGDILQRWINDSARFQIGLIRLLDAVERRRVPAPLAERDSLLEFERRRSAKEELLEVIIATIVTLTDAQRWLNAAGDPAIVLHSHDQPAAETDAPAPEMENAAAGDALDIRLFRGLLTADPAALEKLWPAVPSLLRREPLLYVPLHRGGHARRIASARAAQQRMRDLLELLPRLGMLNHTCQLINLAREIENDLPVGAHAVSEFDRLFGVGYKAMVESLVDVSQVWGNSGESTSDRENTADRELVECLEGFTESLLEQWLAHSRTLRLSSLERVANDPQWQALVEFIEKYGHDLFTQRFLNLSNVRAILHQGIDAWLTQVLEQPDAKDELKLSADLNSGTLNRSDAVRCLSIVLEAIAENYTEYRDYNTTTTQSDRGELLFGLLDFLRLRVQYDRVAWHLRPVLLAHEILVRHRREGAAEMWRRALAERTSEVADKLLGRYAALCRRYGMQLPTVADRLGQRFLQPLSIDRLRALVRPAIQEVHTVGEGLAFAVLRQEAQELMSQTVGSGLDVPSWLQALEAEASDAAHTISNDSRQWTAEAIASCHDFSRCATGIERLATRQLIVAFPTAAIRRAIGAWTTPLVVDFPATTASERGYRPRFRSCPALFPLCPSHAQSMMRIRAKRRTGFSCQQSPNGDVLAIDRPTWWGRARMLVKL